MFQDLLEQYTDSYGNPVIHLALFTNDLNLLQRLLYCYISSTFINKRDQNGYTAWDHASLKADVQAIQVLEGHPLFEQVCLNIDLAQMK